MDKKKLLLLATLPLLVSCSNGGSSDLEIPTIDVENIKLDLPAKPEFNKGAIKTDGVYDYIDIYESSDFHGAVNTDSGSSGTKIGLARMSQYLKQQRETNEGGTVVVSGGDMWQGSADSNLTHGYVVTHSMNYMGFDTMTLGNHEFDWTDEWIKKNKGISDFEYLCANLKVKNTGELASFVKPSKVITRGDYKIGIVGTIGHVEYAIIPTAIENYKFTDDTEAAEAEAKRLKEEEKCDVVIWTDHSSADKMKTTIPEIDVYFGGHAHVAYDNEQDYHPCMAVPEYGTQIAHVQLKINKETKEVTCNRENSGLVKFSDIASTISEEPNVKSIVTQYAAETNKVKEIEIGNAKGSLKAEDELANLCVKAITEEANRIVKQKELETGKIYAGFHNTKGGVRDNITEGVIKYGDVYRAFPFDNQIVLFKLDGKSVKSLFTSTSSKLSGCARYRLFDSFDEFESGKEYYFCTTDYIAQSYLGLEEDKYVSTYVFVRDVVAQFIKNEGKIDSYDFQRKFNPEYQNPSK